MFARCSTVIGTNYPTGDEASSPRKKRAGLRSQPLARIAAGQPGRAAGRGAGRFDDGPTSTSAARAPERTRKFLVGGQAKVALVHRAASSTRPWTPRPSRSTDGPADRAVRHTFGAIDIVVSAYCWRHLDAAMRYGSVPPIDIAIGVNSSRIFSGLNAQKKVIWLHNPPTLRQHVAFGSIFMLYFHLLVRHMLC